MQHVYIAACAQNGGIYHYTMDENGVLTEKDVTPCPSPMYLVKEGNRLYAPLRGGESEKNESFLVTFAVNGDGSLCQEDGSLSTKGSCACHLTVKDGVTWAVNYLSGSVVRLPEGTLATHTGSGPHPTRQESPHTHYVCLSPDGSHLLVTDLGIDAILLYTKELCEIGRLTLPAGSGPRHLAFSPDGKLLYCANELGCSVSIFAYDGVNSKLLETVPTLPADFKGQNTTAAIRVVGDELFVSDRGLDAITVFRRVGNTLSLSYRIPCGGSSPRDFNITPDGRFLICTNEFSDLVTVFARKDGKFERLPQALTLPRPLCVIF
jgi:6-phosphogluconolactonase